MRDSTLVWWATVRVRADMIYTRPGPGSCSAKYLSTLFIKNISVLGEAEASAYLQVNSGTRGLTKGTK